MTVLKRWRDRGYHSEYSKDNLPLTKSIIQSDWEALYTGPEIATFFVYAQFFTSLWCVLTYSTGMPILYPVAAFNYTVIYWVYKYLIINHYQKTTSFNQDMPNFTINFYRIAVILHLVVGAWIYTNSSILSPANIEFLHAIEDIFDGIFGLDHPFSRFGSSIGLLYSIFILIALSLIAIRKVGWEVLRVLYFFFCCNAQKGPLQQKAEIQLKI